MSARSEAVSRVLAKVADSLVADRPHDVMTDAARIGRLCHFIPGQPELLDGVLSAAPPVDPGITRGEYAAQLRAVAA